MSYMHHNKGRKSKNNTYTAKPRNCSLWLDKIKNKLLFLINHCTCSWQIWGQAEKSKNNTYTCKTEKQIKQSTLAGGALNNCNQQIIKTNQKTKTSNIIYNMYSKKKTGGKWNILRFSSLPELKTTSRVTIQKDTICKDMARLSDTLYYCTIYEYKIWVFIYFISSH